MNPIISFLPLVGRPDPDRLRDFLGKLRDGGVDQLLLYARSGMEVDYMSEEWRALCEVCISFARSHGMRIWLYDDFNWPSGSCMNRVAHADPAFVAKRFVCEKGVLRVERMKTDEKNCTFEPFAVDLFNPDAVDCFLSMTHEKYFEWFASDFGGTIAGFFTDEPSFDYTVAREHFDPALCRLPYFDGIEEAYHALCGKDLREEIRAYAAGEDCPDFQLRYNRLLADRFRESYVRRLSDWCRAHSVALTGHFYGDNSIYNAIQVTGDLFECLDLMDLPGVDELNSAVLPETDLVFAQIADLRAHGAKHAMAELFGLGPCSMPYASRNRYLWYAAVHGVDHFFMVSHYDLRGNLKKNTYFSNFSPDSPDFLAAPALTESAKEAVVYAGKTPLVTLSLRYPFTACASTLRDRAPAHYDALFKECIDALNARQLGWKLIRETDRSDTEYTLRFGDGGITEEQSGRFFPDISALDAFLSGLTPVITVTGKNGKTAERLRLKAFTDGSFVVLDASDTPGPARELILHRSGERIPFRLEPFGVFTDRTVAPAVRTHSLALTPDRVEFPSDNLLRVFFSDDKTFRFTLDRDAVLTLHMRRYPAPSALLLDGAPTTFGRFPAALPDCMTSLYEASPPLPLAAGEHFLSTDGTDSDFLPLVLLWGDFIPHDDSRITVGRESPFGESFFGRAIVCRTLPIPAEAEGLVLTYRNNLLAAMAELDGERLGLRAFPPYSFPIPDRFRGRTAELRLTLCSSMAPLFGKLTDPGIVWGMRVSDPERLCLEELRLEWN